MRFPPLSLRYFICSGVTQTHPVEVLYVLALQHSGLDGFLENIASSPLCNGTVSPWLFTSSGEYHVDGLPLGPVIAGPALGTPCCMLYAIGAPTHPSRNLP